RWGRNGHAEAPSSRRGRAPRDATRTYGPPARRWVSGWLRLCVGVVNVGLALAVWTFPADAATAPVQCAGTLAQPVPAAAAAGTPCWAEIAPYPFGATGEAVDPGSPACSSAPFGVRGECYLTVSSFAFRAPNRGLAAMVNDTP